MKLLISSPQTEHSLRHMSEKKQEILPHDNLWIFPKMEPRRPIQISPCKLGILVSLCIIGTQVRLYQPSCWLKAILKVYEATKQRVRV
jgi:hypothetical protein